MGLFNGDREPRSRRGPLLPGLFALVLGLSGGSVDAQQRVATSSRAVDSDAALFADRERMWEADAIERHCTELANNAMPKIRAGLRIDKKTQSDFYESCPGLLERLVLRLSPKSSSAGGSSSSGGGNGN